MFRRIAVALVVTAGFSVACSDPHSPPLVGELEVLSGDGQTGRAGEPLSQQIEVRALWEDGSEAVYSIWVQLAQGSGFVDLGGAQAGGEGVTVAAPVGRARVRWTLGPESGAQQLRFFAVRADGDTVAAVVMATATP
ncbi:MAG: hypothetical protein R3E10_14760 [Gemmatimonadota bacterium]